MIWRRLAFTTLVLFTSLALLALMAAALFTPKGVDIWGIAMLFMYALTLPWSSIGFWNAWVGFLILAFVKDPEAFVSPFLKNYDSECAITSSTALCVCIRNEDTKRLSRNLLWMLNSLTSTDASKAFHIYILSDSIHKPLIEQERALAGELNTRFFGQVEVTYRLRSDKIGFKAGNIRDFLDNWGFKHEFFIVLDADSVMSSKAILRLVRIMQANPSIGIIQTLVTGLPSNSAFARIFQFGMRLGMRSWTLGSAWWQADCGPYWGHNAIVRTKPFQQYCMLPTLPGKPPMGGHVLSHDQLEAVLMRRAGYEVRVIPDEYGSWEENPPNLVEFIRRDLRWCQGNMQYVNFLRMPGILGVSRVQLLLAISMYLTGPGWIGLTLFGLIRNGPVDTTLTFILLLVSLAMSFTPKFVTLTNVLCKKTLRAGYGGTTRIIISTFTETLLTMLIAPIVSVSVTIFITCMLFGKHIGWDAQQRDISGVSLRLAVRRLWIHFILGVTLFYAIFSLMPSALLISAPIYTGLITAIFIAIVTGLPRVGNWARDIGICQLPEECSHTPQSLESPFDISKLFDHEQGYK